jgi:hypothetical protein
VTIGTPTPAGLSTTARAARGGGSWAIVFIAGLGSLALSLVSGSHVIFAVITLPLVASMAWSSPTTLISILPVWMVLLGFVRRFTPGGGNVTFSGDPVLLIGPVALIVLLLVTLSARGAPPMSRLARVVLGFNIVALIEVANPSQGGLMAGLGGLLFVFVPTVAFWIGRRFGTEELLWRVAWNVAILSLLVALYGLYQQFVRFPTWDLTWIASKGYTALNLGSGVIRAFSTFSSAQEYAVFLSVGVVTWAILASRASRLPFPVHMAGLATVAADTVEGQQAMADAERDLVMSYDVTGALGDLEDATERDIDTVYNRLLEVSYPLAASRTALMVKIISGVATSVLESSTSGPLPIGATAVPTTSKGRSPSGRSASSTRRPRRASRASSATA